jgi:hypothetical protein
MPDRGEPAGEAAQRKMEELARLLTEQIEVSKAMRMELRAMIEEARAALLARPGGDVAGEDGVAATAGKGRGAGAAGRHLAGLVAKVARTAAVIEHLRADLRIGEGISVTGDDSRDEALLDGVRARLRVAEVALEDAIDDLAEAFEALAAKARRGRDEPGEIRRTISCRLLYAPPRPRSSRRRMLARCGHAREHAVCVGAALFVA